MWNDQIDLIENCDFEKNKNPDNQQIVDLKIDPESLKFQKLGSMLRSFAPICSGWKCIVNSSYERESSEVCRSVILDVKMYRFPYENFEVDIFRNKIHENYENQNINSQDLRFR